MKAASKVTHRVLVDRLNKNMIGVFSKRREFLELKELESVITEIMTIGIMTAVNNGVLEVPLNQKYISRHNRHVSA